MLTLLSATLTKPIRAQTARVPTVIEYIAGPNVYVPLGTGAGLAIGDTVEVSIQNSVAGLLRVVSASDRRSVLTFAGNPFMLSRGDQIELVYSPRPSAASDEVVAAPGTTPSGQTQTSLMSAGSATGVRRPVSAHGRLSFGYHSNRSTTTSSVEDLAPVKRTFYSPSVRLRAVVRNLPGGFGARMNMSISYRYFYPSSTSSSTLPRVYSLSVSKEFDSLPVTLEAGRFYNTNENFSGYWDGVSVRVGSNAFGAGVVAGFEPDRANEAFSSTLPKYSTFIDFAVRKGSLIYSADVSLHTVRPNNGLMNHTFLGVRHDLRNGFLRLHQEIQADVDPETDAWTVTRFAARAVVPAGSGVMLRGGYSMRRPYSIWRLTQVISYRRDRASGGIQIPLGRGSMGFDVAVNRSENSTWSPTYITTMIIPGNMLSGFGLNGSMMYWTRDDFSVFSTNTGVLRAFGRVRAGSAYQYYRTSSPNGVLVTHSLSASADVDFGRGVGGRLQARTQFGELVVSNTLAGTLSVNF